MTTPPISRSNAARFLFPLRYDGIRTGVLRAGALFCLAGLAATAAAQDPAPTYTWSGNGGNNLYSNGGNWTNGNTPGYGNLNFGNSTTNTTVDVDTTGLAQHAIYFISSSNYTLTDNGFTFFDYSGYPSKIENDGTGLGTVNVPLTFNSGTSGSTGLNRIEINAITGNLTFGAAGTISLTGSAVSGIQLFGTGHTVTFNAAISESSSTSRYFEINQGNTAVFGAANTYSGNTDVYDGSTLQFAAGGSAANSIIRLGNDDGSGITAGSGTNTLSLINATGGQTVSSVLVVAAGTGMLSSTNSSGTNTYAGGIYLDTNLGISATAAGGTFVIAGALDVKAKALTISGAGVVNVANGIQSSGGGGTVVYAGTGTLLLNGNGNNTGTTTINSGTLGGSGTLAGPVAVNAATLNPGLIGAAGSAAAVGTLTTGALTLASTSTSVFDLAGSTSYDQLIANGNVTLAGTLTINDPNVFAAGTVFDLVHIASGGTVSGTYSGIVNGGFYTFGNQLFQAEYTGTDFELVAVPEPATWLAGFLLVGAAGVALRRGWTGTRVARRD